MRIIRQIQSWLLGVLATVFLAGAICIGYRVVVLGRADPSITVAALLATVAGLFLTLQRQLTDRQEATSKFYLEKYEAGFDTAYNILESVSTAGDSQTRLKWIAAARVLATARDLFDRITVPAHRDVARMGIPFQSQRFQQFFQLPPWYYYGTVPAANVGYAEKITEAAKRSTAREGTTVSTLRSIPERVIHTVWLAVQYPQDYQDVLGERFPDGRELFLPPGLRDYVTHHAQWHSAAGELHQRGANEKVE